MICRRRLGRTSVRTAGILGVVTTMASVSPAFTSEPNLYERIALGSLVVHGRCRASERRAAIDVLEVLKGAYSEAALQVSFRSDNFNRSPGTARIEFEPGRESILILESERDQRGRLRASDRFELVGEAHGKIDLPSEGGPALLAAAKRLVTIQSMKDQAAVWAAQRDLVRDPNPHLVAVGFDEILKFRLGEESLVVPLLGHLAGPRPELRRQALRVIGQMFARQRRTGQAVPSSALLAREALARATGDESSETRAEAVRTLRELRRADLTDPLARLASSDPSQMVRYEAELALLELRRAQ